MNICLIGESAISPSTEVQVCDWLHFWAKKVHRLFGQLQLAACLGGVLKFHRFMGSAIYLWNMSISLSNWRMACVVWVRVLTKSGDGEWVPRGLKIPIRWAKIPAVGKRTTTAPLLHKSTGSTFDASTLPLLIHIASAFPMACVHPLPPWTLAVVALVQALCTLHGCRWPEFTWFTHQPQIYALPRRLAPPIEQLGKFQIERDDNFLEQRCWILQQWARECK